VGLVEAEDLTGRSGIAGSGVISCRQVERYLLDQVATVFEIY